jgi:uncharacterized protein
LIVVSDASPYLNLSAIGRLSLLRELYVEVVIPPAVQTELLRNGVEIEASWTRVVAPVNLDQVAELRAELDSGEAEAIIVALELSAGLLLIDEKLGRRIAAERGLQVTGLLGVLAEAKARHLIHECRPILDQMIRVAGFWISEDLRTRYLVVLNEIE